MGKRTVRVSEGEKGERRALRGREDEEPSRGKAKVGGRNQTAGRANGLGDAGGARGGRRGREMGEGERATRGLLAMATVNWHRQWEPVGG